MSNRTSTASGPVEPPAATVDVVTKIEPATESGGLSPTARSSRRSSTSSSHLTTPSHRSSSSSTEDSHSESERDGGKNSVEYSGGRAISPTAKDAEKPDANKVKQEDVLSKKKSAVSKKPAPKAQSKAKLAVQQVAKRVGALAANSKKMKNSALEITPGLPGKTLLYDSETGKKKTHPTKFDRLFSKYDATCDSSTLTNYGIIKHARGQNPEREPEPIATESRNFLLNLLQCLTPYFDQFQQDFSYFAAIGPRGECVKSKDFVELIRHYVNSYLRSNHGRLFPPPEFDNIHLLQQKEAEAQRERERQHLASVPGAAVSTTGDEKQALSRMMKKSFFGKSSRVIGMSAMTPGQGKKGPGGVDRPDLPRIPLYSDIVVMREGSMSALKHLSMRRKDKEKEAEANMKAKGGTPAVGNQKNATGKKDTTSEDDTADDNKDDDGRDTEQHVETLPAKDLRLMSDIDAGSLNATLGESDFSFSPSSKTKSSLKPGTGNIASATSNRGLKFVEPDDKKDGIASPDFGDVSSSTTASPTNRGEKSVRISLGGGGSEDNAFGQLTQIEEFEESSTDDEGDLGECKKPASFVAFGDAPPSSPSKKGGNIKKISQKRKHPKSDGFAAVVEDADLFNDCLWRLFHALDVEDNDSVTWEVFSDYITDASVKGPVRPQSEIVNLYEGNPVIQRDKRPVLQVQLLEHWGPSKIGVQTSASFTAHGEKESLIEIWDPSVVPARSTTDEDDTKTRGGKRGPGGKLKKLYSLVPTVAAGGGSKSEDKKAEKGGGGWGKRINQIWCHSTVVGFEYLPQCRALLVSSSDLNFRLYDVRYSRAPPLHEFCAEDSFTYIKWVPRWNKLFMAGNNGAISQWAVPKNLIKNQLKFKKCHSEKIHSSSVTALFFLPNDGAIVSASMDPRLVIQEPTRGDVIARLEGHKAAIRSVSYSAEHHYLASCGFDAEVFLWCLHSVDMTGTGPRSVKPVLLSDKEEPHLQPIVSVNFVPNSPQLISLDHGGLLKIWDMRTYRCVQNLYVDGGQRVRVRQGNRDKEYIGMLYLPGRQEALSYTHKYMRMTKYTDKHRDQDLTRAEDVFVGTAYSPSSGSVVSATQAGLQMWELQSGVKSGEAKHLLPASALLPPKPQQADSVASKINFSTATSGVASASGDAEITAVTMDTSGRKVLVGFRHGICQYFSAINGQPFRRIDTADVRRRAEADSREYQQSTLRRLQADGRGKLSAAMSEKLGASISTGSRKLIQGNDIVDLACQGSYGVSFAVDSAGAVFGFSDRADSLGLIELESDQQARYLRVSDTCRCLLVMHQSHVINVYSLRPHKGDPPAFQCKINIVPPKPMTAASRSLLAGRSPSPFSSDTATPVPGLCRPVDDSALGFSGQKGDGLSPMLGAPKGLPSASSSFQSPVSFALTRDGQSGTASGLTSPTTRRLSGTPGSLQAAAGTSTNLRSLRSMKSKGDFKSVANLVAAGVGNAAKERQKKEKKDDELMQGLLDGSEGSGPNALAGLGGLGSDMDGGEISCATFAGSLPFFICVDSAGFLSIWTIPPHPQPHICVARYEIVAHWELSTMAYCERFHVLYTGDAGGGLCAYDMRSLEQSTPEALRNVLSGDAGSLRQSRRSTAIMSPTQRRDRAKSLFERNFGDASKNDTFLDELEGYETLLPDADDPTYCPDSTITIKHIADVGVGAAVPPNPGGEANEVKKSYRIQSILLIPSLRLLVVNTSDRFLAVFPYNLLAEGPGHAPLAIKDVSDQSILAPSSTTQGDQVGAGIGTCGVLSLDRNAYRLPPEAAKIEKELLRMMAKSRVPGRLVLVQRKEAPPPMVEVFSPTHGLTGLSKINALVGRRGSEGLSSRRGSESRGSDSSVEGGSSGTGSARRHNRSPQVSILGRPDIACADPLTAMFTPPTGALNSGTRSQITHPSQTLSPGLGNDLLAKSPAMTRGSSPGASMRKSATKVNEDGTIETATSELNRSRLAEVVDKFRPIKASSVLNKSVRDLVRSLRPSSPPPATGEPSSKKASTPSKEKQQQQQTPTLQPGSPPRRRGNEADAHMLLSGDQGKTLSESLLMAGATMVIEIDIVSPRAATKKTLSRKDDPSSPTSPQKKVALMDPVGLSSPLGRSKMSDEKSLWQADEEDKEDFARNPSHMTNCRHTPCVLPVVELEPPLPLGRPTQRPPTRGDSATTTRINARFKPPRNVKELSLRERREQTRHNSERQWAKMKEVSNEVDRANVIQQEVDGEDDGRDDLPSRGGAGGYARKSGITPQAVKMFDKNMKAQQEMRQLEIEEGKRKLQQVIDTPMKRMNPSSVQCLMDQRSYGGTVERLQKRRNRLLLDATGMTVQNEDGSVTEVATVVEPVREWNVQQLTSQGWTPSIRSQSRGNVTRDDSTWHQHQQLQEKTNDGLTPSVTPYGATISLVETPTATSILPDRRAMTPMMLQSTTPVAQMVKDAPQYHSPAQSSHHGAITSGDISVDHSVVALPAQFPSLQPRHRAGTPSAMTRTSNLVTQNQNTRAPGATTATSSPTVQEKAKLKQKKMTGGPSKEEVEEQILVSQGPGAARFKAPFPGIFFPKTRGAAAGLPRRN